MVLFIVSTPLCLLEPAVSLIDRVELSNSARKQTVPDSRFIFLNSSLWTVRAGTKKPEPWGSGRKAAMKVQPGGNTSDQTE